MRCLVGYAGKMPVGDCVVVAGSSKAFPEIEFAVFAVGCYWFGLKIYFGIGARAEHYLSSFAGSDGHLFFQ